MPRGVKVFWVVVTVLFGAYATRTLFFGHALPVLFDHYLSSVLLAAAACSCLLRGFLVPQGRAPWIFAGLGIASWTIGDICWTFSVASDPNAPFPSVADFFYLLEYPAFYVSLLLLVRSTSHPLGGGLWLDGAIGALAVGAVVAALAVDTIIGAASGNGPAIATGLAYPIFDLILVALVICVFGISGWRPGRAWMLLGAGFGLTALADIVYFFESVTDSYQEGTPLDILWPTASLLVGLAAWQRSHSVKEASVQGSRVVAIPFLSGIAALGLLTYDHFTRLGVVALGLTAATLCLVMLRMAMAFRDRARLLATSREEALMDPLTGLRNRRCLMADLESDLPRATLERPLALLLFDLNGFKAYNDTFGHLAGDALLARLADTLAETVESRGRAYRLGGDEFCALVAPGAGLESIGAACVTALSEHGEAFTVSTAYGAALIPEEADTAVEALKVADRRMYAEKGGGRLSAGRQSRDVLLSTLSERQPDLQIHLEGVAELAIQVGRELGMPGEELDELARAAELHDIGKVAIPNEILEKTGLLEDHEWSFIRRHTIIGERILMAAPALRPVAKLVRSTHERFDGTGYPDGILGEEIPLGSRIVAVCDAFDAMTADRSYRGALTEKQALEELLACAGTQFDPKVVEAFCSLHSRPRVAAAIEAGAEVASPAPPALP
ncbi:MAG TPA: diguanylate cyclase [Thermoleophilaceae bacterium]